METKEIEVIKKATINIDTYKERFNKIIIDSERSIEDAESLQSQVKAAKAQVNAATKLDWTRKKDKYEKYRDASAKHQEKLKKEYHEIRDKRKMLMGACADIFAGIKKKIEDFRAECVRKAEEEKKKVVDVEEVVMAQCDHGKYPDETCEECGRWGECDGSEINHDEAPTQPTTDKTTPPAPKPPQKLDKETKEAIAHGFAIGGILRDNETQKAEQFTIEIFNVRQFYGALMRAERGVKEENLTITVSGLEKIAKEYNCKLGDIVVAGAWVKENN